MGTDIHTFVEYSSDVPHCAFSATPHRPHICLQNFFSRAIMLFSMCWEMAATRILAKSQLKRHALVSPRGLPCDISHAVAREYYDLITDTEHPNAMFWPSHGCISEAVATSRVALSSSLRNGRTGYPFRQWTTATKMASCFEAVLAHPKLAKRPRSPCLS